jgi:hypothetical protein
MSVVLNFHGEREEENVCPKMFLREAIMNFILCQILFTNWFLDLYRQLLTLIFSYF